MGRASTHLIDDESPPKREAYEGPKIKCFAVIICLDSRRTPWNTDAFGSVEPAPSSGEPLDAGLGVCGALSFASEADSFGSGELLAIWAASSDDEVLESGGARIMCDALKRSRNVAP